MTVDVRPMDAYLSAMTESLVKLCRIPSVKGEPTPDAPYGSETLQALEAFLEIGRELGFTAVNLDGRAGYVEAGSGDRLVAALCHLDVVPAGTGWETDPFSPVIRDGRIIARGTADDKGPAIAALYALKALVDEGTPLKSRVRIIVGLDEESGSTCMEHYVAVAELPDAGFTPDAEFPVIYAEKGIAWYRLTMVRQAAHTGAALSVLSGAGGERPNMVPGSCSLTYRSVNQENTIHYAGRTAHGSRPDKGENAVATAMADAAIRLAQAGTSDPFVDAFNTLIGRTTDGSGLDIAGKDESGPLTLNAGVLALEPGLASLDLDIRYPVTWSLQDLDDRLTRSAAMHGLKTTLLREQKPLYAPRETPLVRDLMNIYRTITGDPAEPLAIGGGTYARSMPHIVAFGPSFPGDPDACHQAGESISLETLDKAARIYREAFRALSETDV